MANPRHAQEHKVFRKFPLPEHMLLVAGVIDTKTNYIEHPEVVADRIALAVEALGDPSRVLAGTDCGFATSAGSDRVHPEVVWEKLKSLRDGAALASQALSW
jgi:5-methyltetrahydropteroyltriglutamate--homocysteine methyltransferase